MSTTEKELQSLTNREHRDMLNTQSSQDLTQNKNYPLLEREPIPHTPFWTVGNKEQGYFLTWGQYRLNEEPLESKDDVIDYLLTNRWNVTLMLISICLQNIDKIKDGANQPKEATL